MTGISGACTALQQSSSVLRVQFVVLRLENLFKKELEFFFVSCCRFTMARGDNVTQSMRGMVRVGVWLESRSTYIWSTLWLGFHELHRYQDFF